MAQWVRRSARNSEILGSTPRAGGRCMTDAVRVITELATSPCQYEAPLNPLAPSILCAFSLNACIESLKLLIAATVRQADVVITGSLLPP